MNFAILFLAVPLAKVSVSVIGFLLKRPGT